MANNTLWMVWTKKIKSPEYIHQFFMDEVFIYNQILSQKQEKLTGRLSDLAKGLNVSNEAFFGFLLGIKPMVKQDLNKMKHRDRINVKLDMAELQKHLKQSANYEHLLDLEGWEASGEKDNTEQLQSSAATSDSATHLGNNGAPEKERSLQREWNNKVQDIDFVHEFFMDELTIYHWISTQEEPIMVGNISELSKYFEVSEEVFYGFLLGIQPLINLDVMSLKNNDYINIEIDVEQLHEHLSQKANCAHLLDLFEG